MLRQNLMEILVLGMIVFHQQTSSARVHGHVANTRKRRNSLLKLFQQGAVTSTSRHLQTDTPANVVNYFRRVIHRKSMFSSARN